MRSSLKLVSCIKELGIVSVLMELLIKLLSTFVAGALWLWWAIPTVMVMGLSPFLRCAASTLGYLVAVLFVVVLTEYLWRCFF